MIRGVKYFGEYKTKTLITTTINKFYLSIHRYLYTLYTFIDNFNKSVHRKNSDLLKKLHKSSIWISFFVLIKTIGIYEISIFIIFLISKTSGNIATICLSSIFRNLWVKSLWRRCRNKRDIKSNVESNRT